MNIFLTIIIDNFIIPNFRSGFCLTNMPLGPYHRHLSILTIKQRVLAALFASLVLLMAAAKKEENKAIKTVLVAGTYQTLSNIFRDFQYLWAVFISLYFLRNF